MTWLDPVWRLAATHGVAWEPDAATLVLEDLQDGGILYGIDAESTLKAIRDGTPNLDW
jgi:hypothetical protein